MINSKSVKTKAEPVLTKRYIVTSVVYAVDPTKINKQDIDIVKIELDEEVKNINPIGYG